MPRYTAINGEKTIVYDSRLQSPYTILVSQRISPYTILVSQRISPYTILVSQRISPYTIVFLRVRSRRNTIVILDHVISQHTVVYGVRKTLPGYCCDIFVYVYCSDFNKFFDKKCIVQYSINAMTFFYT
jgi:hypothetical protein